MRKFNLSRVVLSPVVLFLLPCSSAGGVLAGISTEWTQLSVLLTHVQQYAQMIQQYERTVQMYENMVVQGENMATHPFEPFAAALQGIYQISTNANSIVYALDKMDVQFNDTFRGFIPPSKGGRAAYNLQYRQWYDSTNAAIQTSLSRAGVNANQLMTSDGMRKALASLASTPQGQNQAIQLGTQVGLIQADSLKRLETLMMTDIQNKSMIAGYQLQQDNAKQQAANVAMYVPRTADQKVY